MLGDDRTCFWAHRQTSLAIRAVTAVGNGLPTWCTSIGKKSSPVVQVQATSINSGGRSVKLSTSSAPEKWQSFALWKWSEWMYSWNSMMFTGTIGWACTARVWWPFSSLTAKVGGAVQYLPPREDRLLLIIDAIKDLAKEKIGQHFLKPLVIFAKRSFIFLFLYFLCGKYFQLLYFNDLVPSSVSSPRVASC